MNRLAHDARAWRRVLEMSRADVWLFCEGPSDRYFYSRVAEHVLGPSRSFRIALAQEVRSGLGGKQALLWLHDRLRRLRSLRFRRAKTEVQVVFLLDKDIDDLLRTQRKSAHIVYTEHYDVEGYAFYGGALVDAMASEGGLDVGVVRASIRGQLSWLRQRADVWREWVTLCVVARRADVKCECNYGVRSQVNTNEFGAVNQNMVDEKLARMRAASGDGGARVDRAWKWARGKVAELYRSRQEGVVFKTKWYREFAAHHVLSIADRGGLQHGALADGIVKGLMQSVDLRQGSGRRYVLALRRALRGQSPLGFSFSTQN